MNALQKRVEEALICPHCNNPHQKGRFEGLVTYNPITEEMATTLRCTKCQTLFHVQVNIPPWAYLRLIGF